MNKSSQRVRYAVVGLGHIAQSAVLPAFAHAKENSELAALVSDDPVKRRALGRKYKIDRLYGYDEFSAALRQGGIDAVYIALPNSMHRKFAVEAAEAGIHVLCEKPMAVTERECEEMILAARRRKVKLMIAYRLHFERANTRAVELARSGKLGDLRLFDSVFSMQVEPGNIRVKKSLGGGPLDDIGIYCLNAARSLFRDEPIEVFAMTASRRQKRFHEVDEMTSALLRFPQERLASFTCSFGAYPVSAYRIVGTKGDLRCEPAFKHADSLKQTLTIMGKKTEQVIPKRDQFAPELIYFSDCVMRGKDPEPSGLEGLADVRVLRALEKSAETGKAVMLGDFHKPKRPGPEQSLHRPPVKEPELVRVRAPNGGK